MKEVSISELVAIVKNSAKAGHYFSFDYIKANGERGTYNNGPFPLSVLSSFKCDGMPSLEELQEMTTAQRRELISRLEEAGLIKPFFNPANNNFTVYCRTRQAVRSFKADTLVSARADGVTLVPRF